MTVSPAIRAALEAARDALAEVVSAYERWLWDDACWDAANSSRLALEKINAALAEMEAQS